MYPFQDRSPVRDDVSSLLTDAGESLATAESVNGIVAEQMARGVRNMADTTWGVSTTGIAGPPEEPHDDPVGTVYVGIARGATDGYDHTAATVEQHRFDGSRSEIRELAARQALEDLYETVAASTAERSP